jgi:hypothetical protein
MQLTEYVKKLNPLEEYLESFEAPLREMTNDIRRISQGVANFNAKLAYLEGLRSTKKRKYYVD